MGAIDSGSHAGRIILTDTGFESAAHNLVYVAIKFGAVDVGVGVNQSHRP